VNVLLPASKIVRLPVVAIDAGEDVAEVKDIVYSPSAGKLLGFTLNKRGFLKGRMKQVLPAEHVHAVGDAAVMIEDDACLVAPDDAPEEVAQPAGERNVLGNAVITEKGVRLGVVSDLILELGDSLAVVGYQLRDDTAGKGAGDKFIPLPAQLAISGEALVVPAETDELCTTTWLASAQRSRTSVPAFREAHGRPVMSRSSAEKIGEVGQFVVDASARRITAVVVGKGRKARVVDWDGIVGFGPDAVMVESDDRLREPNDGETKTDWLGRRVMTDLGFELGPLEDVEFDAESGAVQSLAVKDGDAISADRVLGAGSFAIVVRSVSLK